MKLTYTDLSRADVPQLAERLESEPYPATCNIVLIEGKSSDGNIKTRQIRLELTPNFPGVLLPLDTYSEHVDWAVGKLVELASTSHSYSS